MMGFGADTKPRPDPTVDQSKVKIDVAFNGWVYEAFSTKDPIAGAGGITIRCSKSGGEFWQDIDSYIVPGINYNAFDIAVVGTDTNDLKLYLVGIRYDSVPDQYLIFEDHYNATTGQYIGSNYNTGNGNNEYYDIAIASDYMNPAVGAAPYSIAFVYSKYNSPVDSIVMNVSVDGGSNFTDIPVATTGSYFGKLSIAYGKGAAASNGRYFIAYEQVATFHARTGNIYTTRNNSTVDGPFIAPVNLDSISSTMIGLCKNPRIAVQNNTIDNDSAAVTAVVTVERDYVGDGSDYDLLGFYNKRAHFTSFWNRLDINNSGTNYLNGEIAYDPIANEFLMTCHDSTDGFLQIYSNVMNLIDPDSWISVASNYNDLTSNLFSPRPTMALNPTTGEINLAWSREESLLNAAYFDAENSTIAPYVSNVNESFCAGTSFIFNGDTYTVAGSYPYSFVASNGLDSTLSLNLTENALPSPTVTIAGSLLSTQAYSTYQWNIGGSAIASANSQDYTALIDGAYSVTVVDANGCTNTSSTYVVTVSGVNELANQGIRYYPNPAGNELTVDVSAFSNDDVAVTLIDGVGQIVLSTNINGSRALDLSSLANGIYQLKISTKDQSATGRLIKQ